MGKRVVIAMVLLAALTIVGVVRPSDGGSPDSIDVPGVKAPVVTRVDDSDRPVPTVNSRPALLPTIPAPRRILPEEEVGLSIAVQVRLAEAAHRRMSEVVQAGHQEPSLRTTSRRTEWTSQTVSATPDLDLTPTGEGHAVDDGADGELPDLGALLRMRSGMSAAGRSPFAEALKDTEMVMRLPAVDEAPAGPSFLNDAPQELAVESLPYVSDELFKWYRDAPLGFSGPSSVMPTEIQENSHFVPMEDRWRIGFPEWDRYGLGHPPEQDYPYMLGRWWDPYNQNVLKGDYPISGQNVFLDLTATSLAAFNGRQVPTATTPFESTFDPNQEEFFGHPSQFFYTHFFSLSFDLFHGDAAFKQPEWRIKATPTFNLNYLAVEELAVVNPDVRRGRTRSRDDWSLQEWFVEKKLADLGPDYDTLSVRAGSQLFVSDFRGFVFADVNRGVRLFGTRLSNREQFNLIWFDQTEKETNSQLNTFDDRHQNTVVANYYRQDTIWPGYTAQLSFHYNRDQPSFLFDKNDFLARPDPVGVFSPHMVETYYVGWSGDGHINRFNISHSFYYVFGRDNLNPLAGQPITVDAKMAAVELSYDRDWARFRTSFFWASGDDDINDDVGGGFDSIFDNPNFGGGEFSYWNRQAIRLFGVNLVQDRSLVPDLRSSKTQGQSNFVNPGLFLYNVGVDMDVTTKIKWINNCNFLWFDRTGVLEQFTFQSDIDDEIGTDISSGIEYRPFLNNNAIIVGGASVLLPARGFRDLYNPIAGKVGTLAAGFLEVILQY